MDSTLSTYYLIWTGHQGLLFSAGNWCIFGGNLDEVIRSPCVHDLTFIALPLAILNSLEPFSRIFLTATWPLDYQLLGFEDINFQMWVFEPVRFFLLHLFEDLESTSGVPGPYDLILNSSESFNWQYHSFSFQRDTDSIRYCFIVRVSPLSPDPPLI